MTAGSDQISALVNRMIEEIQNRRNIGLCDEIFSDAFVNHTPPPGISGDRDGMRRLFSMVHIGFPDGRITVEDQVSGNGKVWTRKTFSGTHAGVFAGVAPTGRVMTYRVVDVLAVRDGKITEHWSVLDRLELFRQLGLIQDRTATHG
jgi:predicted ester cyclase